MLEKFNTKNAFEYTKLTEEECKKMKKELIKEINELLTKNKIPIKPDTIKLKGIQENQLMWKDILLKDISVGYYNVSKINVALFDRSISSLKQKMK